MTEEHCTNAQMHTAIDFDLKEMRRVVHKCFPRVRTELWRYVDDGVACHVVIAGENSNPQTVFRFPQFDFVARRMTLEVELLRILGKEDIGLHIPNPVYACAGTAEYSWPFMGYPIIHGMQLSEQVFSKMQSKQATQKITRQLGHFLGNLHSLDITKALSIGLDDDRDLSKTTDLWGEVQTKAFSVLDHAQRRWVTELFEGFLAECRSLTFTPALIHGDLSHQHILVDTSACEIRGIIDFGEARIGDPAFDFVELYATYGLPFASTVMAQYSQPVDAGFPTRIHFYLQTSSLRAIVCGVELGRTDYITWGRDQLREAMEQQGQIQGLL